MAPQTQSQTSLANKPTTNREHPATRAVTLASTVTVIGEDKKTIEDEDSEEDLEEETTEEGEGDTSHEADTKPMKDIDHLAGAGDDRVCYLMI